jgi:hypothetical protein
MYAVAPGFVITPKWIFIHPAPLLPNVTQNVNSKPDKQAVRVAHAALNTSVFHATLKME